MTINEAVHILRNILPAHPQACVRHAGIIVVEEMSQDLEHPWHPCAYKESKLEHDGTWTDGRWYEWLDRFNNREYARMKLDAYDHFYPSTKIIKEKDVIAFRELRR